MKVLTSQPIQNFQSGFRAVAAFLRLALCGVALGICSIAFLPSAASAAEAPSKNLNDVGVRLEPIADGIPIIEPGEKGKASFLFTNSATRELQLAWKVQIYLPGNTPGDRNRVAKPDLEQTEKIELPAGGNKRLIMPDAVAIKRGVVTFDWQMTDQDGRTLALKDNLAVMTFPGPEKSHRGNFRFGWGTGLVHFVYEADDPKLMPLYEKMGCDIIRVGDKWAMSEYKGDASTANANTKYWADAETTINAANAAGMDLLYVMWGTPLNLYRKGFANESKIEQLAKDNNVTFGLMQRVRPPDPAAWKQRVTDTVTRFKDKVKYWEIWNDEDRSDDGSHHMPNGWVGSTDEYLGLLRDASETIKKIDPSLAVLNGGFFTVGLSDKHNLNPDMVKRVVSEGQNSFDIFAGFDTNPSILLGPMADLRTQLKPEKPLWLTRVEQHGASPDELVRRLLSAKGCGASSFIWMWGMSFDSGWRGFMVKMSSWKTKNRTSINIHSVSQMSPAGCAYTHAIGLLRSLPASGRMDTGINGQWLFTFADPTHKDLRQVVGLWLDEKMSDAAVNIRVGSNATCSLIDLYGNTEPLPVTNGVVQAPVRRTPAYLLVLRGDPVTLAH